MLKRRVLTELCKAWSIISPERRFYHPSSIPYLPFIRLSYGRTLTSGCVSDNRHLLISGFVTVWSIATKLVWYKKSRSITTFGRFHNSSNFIPLNQQWSKINSTKMPLAIFISRIMSGDRYNCHNWNLLIIIYLIKNDDASAGKMNCSESINLRTCALHVYRLRLDHYQWYKLWIIYPK